METPYIGMIKTTAQNFAPAGWLFCDGRILLINEYRSLFSLLGTRFGGDGNATFALPDMRDPANRMYYRGFGPEQPLKYIICLHGVYPQPAY